MNPSQFITEFLYSLPVLAPATGVEHRAGTTSKDDTNANYAPSEAPVSPASTIGYQPRTTSSAARAPCGTAASPSATAVTDHPSLPVSPVPSVMSLNHSVHCAAPTAGCRLQSAADASSSRLIEFHRRCSPDAAMPVYSVPSSAAVDTAVVAGVVLAFDSLCAAGDAFWARLQRDRPRDSVASAVVPIAEAGLCTAESLIYAVALAQRLHSNVSPKYICHSTAKRVSVAAISIATKVHDDRYFSLHVYRAVCGMSEATIFQAELQLLKHLDHRVVLWPDDWNRARDSCLELASATAHASSCTHSAPIVQLAALASPTVVVGQ